MESLIKQCSPQIFGAARRVARERGLPWELAKLREHGFVGARRASEDYSSSTLGLPFPQFAWKYIYQAADQAAGIILAQRDAEDTEGRSPSEERIEEALKFFTEDDWKHLIAKFEYRDLDPLRSYLGDADRLENLARTFPGPIIRAVFNSVSARYIILALEGARSFVNVSDPAWAAHMRDKARKHNLRGDPSPFKNITWAEFGQYRNIARSLGVTDKRVAKWFERMARVPIDKFDGDPYDYFFWVANPDAYARRQRGKRSH